MTATRQSAGVDAERFPDEFDVVVVGAGIVGAASACLFARQGLRVGLVEAQGLNGGGTNERKEKVADARVSAINLAARQLFETLGIWSQITESGAASAVCPYDGMRVWERDGTAKISFAAAELGEECLGYIIENRAMVAAMLDALRQNARVQILDHTEVTAIHRHAHAGQPAATKLRLDLSGGLNQLRTQLQTRLLVGADGAHSRVRDLCGARTAFADFAQDAIVATASTARAHGTIARQCFLETGPVALLPLADGRCSLVWSCDRAQAEQLMALDSAAFCARLQSVFFHELGEITGCQSRQRFALTQHHAARYIADSVALIGDAAHTIHPLAGLGANIGLLDAAALAEVVAQASSRGHDISQHSVLRRYERWRRGDNALVQGMMKGFKEVFGSRLATAKAVRGAGMNLVDALPPLKMLLANYATGLHGDLPATCRARSTQVDGV